MKKHCYLPVPSEFSIDHEAYVVGKLLNSVDPHDEDGLEDGHPEDSDAAAVGVHDVKDVLAGICHDREAVNS